MSSVKKNSNYREEALEAKIAGAKYFTRLDTRDGSYEWTVVCFGLKSAPAEFARYMNNLRGYLNEFVVAYFDDIVIYSNDLDSHWKHLSRGAAP